jgi:hypothetical protein
MQITSETNSRFAGPSLGVATAVTLVTSVIAVIVVRAIAVGIVTVPAAFTPLSKASTSIMLTILGVLAASGSCLLLNHFVDRPVATFRRVAPIALAFSFIPDIAIWVGHAFHHSAKASTVIPLMIMHVIVAALCLTVLPRLGTARADVRTVAASAL